MGCIALVRCVLVLRCGLAGALTRCPFSTNVFSVSKSCPTLFETVGLRVPNRNYRALFCLTLALNVETALPLVSLRQQIPSAVILTHSIDVRSQCLASIRYLYYMIQKLSDLRSCRCSKL